MRTDRWKFFCGGVNPLSCFRWNSASDLSIVGIFSVHFYKQNIIISYTKLYFTGVVAFDDKTGFWLIHSVPNFPDPREYGYPETATNNGQTAICITFKTSELNEIGKFVFYNT